MGSSIEIVVANSNLLRQQLFEIRRKVFVEEQNVDPEEEYDSFETSSTQLVALFNKLPVGTCRFRNTENGIKLERFAVLNGYRGLGIGAALVKACLDKIDTSQTVYLHSQIQVVDFYAGFGFEKSGTQFDEAGIQHYKMVYVAH